MVCYDTATGGVFFGCGRKRDDASHTADDAGGPLSRARTSPACRNGASPDSGGEALVRITHAGVCRTELHFLSGLLNLGIAPLTLGHEIVGEVVLTDAAVGSAQPGDRVVVNYYGTCGQCVWCRTGQQNLCSHVVAPTGSTADGGYAEFVKARADMLVPLPTHLDAAQACTLG